MEVPKNNDTTTSGNHEYLESNEGNINVDCGSAKRNRIKMEEIMAQRLQEITNTWNQIKGKLM